MVLNACLLGSVARSRDSGVLVILTLACKARLEAEKRRKGQWANSLENEDVRLKKRGYR